MENKLDYIIQLAENIGYTGNDDRIEEILPYIDHQNIRVKDAVLFALRSVRPVKIFEKLVNMYREKGDEIIREILKGMDLKKVSDRAKKIVENDPDFIPILIEIYDTSLEINIDIDRIPLEYKTQSMMLMDENSLKTAVEKIDWIDIDNYYVKSLSKYDEPIFVEKLIECFENESLIEECLKSAIKIGLSDLIEGKDVLYDNIKKVYNTTELKSLKELSAVVMVWRKKWGGENYFEFIFNEGLKDIFSQGYFIYRNLFDNWNIIDDINEFESEKGCLLLIDCFHLLSVEDKIYLLKTTINLGFKLPDEFIENIIYKEDENIVYYVVKNMEKVGNIKMIRKLVDNDIPTFLLVFILKALGKKGSCEDRNAIFKFINHQDQSIRDIAKESLLEIERREGCKGTEI